MEPVKGGDAAELTADVVLLSIGRRPLTAGLGLDELGVELDKRGAIVVDADFESNVKGVFAIGDVIPGRFWRQRPKRTGSPAARSWPGSRALVTKAWARNDRQSQRLNISPSSATRNAY